MKKLAAVLALLCGCSFAQFSVATAGWVDVKHFVCPGTRGSFWPTADWNPVVIGPLANNWSSNQIYDPTTSYCDGSGNFVLQANSGSPPTSGWMSTGKFLAGQAATPSLTWLPPFAVKITATYPYCSGCWPASFLLDTRYINQVNWGEIDYAEEFGSTSSAGGQSAHTMNQASINWNNAVNCGAGNSFDTIPAGGSLTGSHSYSVVVINNNVYHFIDDVLLNAEHAPDGCTYQLNAAYMLELDLLIGAAGSVPGAPSGLVYPVTFTISSIDVYQPPRLFSGQNLPSGQKVQ